MAETTQNTSKGKTKPESWGYDLYPERRGDHKVSVKGLLTMTEGKEEIQRGKCETNVFKCVQDNPLVKLMMGALKKSGCEIDIRRHITCEVCDTSVSGGYDPEYNQIVVCQNVAKTKGIVGGVLTHEMIHMFDYCRKNLDFKNMEHLACTEIRAANLTHCSITSAMTQGDASVINIRKRHQQCVKTKAVYSVLSVRQIGLEDAVAVVNKVFPKCYADLEPIGRRVRRNSRDMEKAYIEGYLYGYDL